MSLRPIDQNWLCFVIRGPKLAGFIAYFRSTNFFLVPSSQPHARATAVLVSKKEYRMMLERWLHANYPDKSILHSLS